MDIILREATLNDIPFLVETIIEAEKSGTDVLTYTTVLGLTEEEAKKYIALMLEEEIDGCEFSISGFLLADLDGETVGACCAWKEGDHDLSSIELKSNLMRYVLPEKSFENLIKLDPILKDTRYKTIDDSITIGLVYVSGKARGRGLARTMVNEHIKILRTDENNPEDVYLLVYGDNHAAINAYKRIGFETIMTKESKNKNVTDYIPSSVRIMMKYNPK